MADKPFIRVRNRETGHEHDIHRQAFDEARHELVEDVEPSKLPRKPKLAEPEAEDAAGVLDESVAPGVTTPSEDADGAKPAEPVEAVESPRKGRAKPPASAEPAGE